MSKHNIGVSCEHVIKNRTFTLKSLLSFFFQLSLLRRTPQELPASGALLAVCMGLNLLTGFVGSISYFGNHATALLASLLDVALMAALLSVTLSFVGKSGRFVQSATAVYAVGALFSVALIVIDAFASVFGLLPVAGMLGLVLLIWVHVVVGHILRHALDLDLWLAVLIAMGYSVIGIIVINQFFPRVG